MSASTSRSTSAVPPAQQAQEEKDMNARLRLLVDNCFEEGHYEDGIATLNRLRSPTQKPSALALLSERRINVDAC
jgi:hypothetical protein